MDRFEMAEQLGLILSEYPYLVRENELLRAENQELRDKYNKLVSDDIKASQTLIGEVIMAVCEVRNA
jgi:regulator of replication initiation timing